MGYSCRADAKNVEAAVLAARSDQTGSNAWVDDTGHSCFVDRGREQSDGAITGTVYRSVSPCSYQESHQIACKRAGSLRIEPDGLVTRWPRASKEMRAEIKIQNCAVNLYRPE